MRRFLAVAAACVIAATGCRMCSNTCDNSPPLAGSPYSNPYGRAGSAFTGPAPGSPLGPQVGTLSPPVSDEPVAPPAKKSDDKTAALEPITAETLGW